MADKKPTFEQMLKKLEGIVAKLESGDLSLDKSLAAFEEGMALVKDLDQTLTQAEAKVELLFKDREGQIKPGPWPEDSGDGLPEPEDES